MPRQKRAKQTVDSILQAAKELLEKEGITHLSTGSIAERAGVNIASLYQYFPNRDSILLSLYEDASNQGALKLNTLALKVIHDSLESLVPKILRLLLTHYQENELILLHIGSDLPEFRRAPHVVPFESMIRSAVRLYLVQHPEFRIQDRQRHLFFLENLVVSNLRRYITDPPDDLSKAEFIAHLSRIVVAYLKGELS